MIWIPLDEADCCHSALYFISSQSRQSCGKGKHNLSRQIASGSATRVWHDGAAGTHLLLVRELERGAVISWHMNVAETTFGFLAEVVFDAQVAALHSW